MSSGHDLRLWLEGLGLGQYAAAFEENDVDFSVLPDLEDADFRELGISLGHRKKLARAIADLGSDEAQGAGLAPTRPGTASTGSAGGAERRQVTFVFCDLIGSTSLSTRYDPEDMGRIIQAYHACCREIVERWGGQVLSYQGDGVFFCLGYPMAHEDDAERAVRASLEIAEAVAKLQPLPGLKLETRLGVATGRVVVGDVIGGAARESSVAGETTNLSKRLQELAKPNTVVLSIGTKRLVERLFDLASIGMHEMKGFAEPVEVWRVEGAHAITSRFDAARSGAPHTLIGRDREMDFLSSRWRKSVDGEGQVVLLSGDAGMGKSHLLAAFCDKIAAQDHHRVRLFCAPYYQNSVLHPVIAHFEALAGITGRETLDEKRRKVEAAFLPLQALNEHAVALISALLSVPTDANYPMPELNSLQQKMMTFELLLANIGRLAKVKPVLVIFEDAHWADPTTLELLDRLINGTVQSDRIMVLLTHRSDFKPPWARSSWITPIVLERLETSSSEALIESVRSKYEIPRHLMEEIVSKADGVPLFIEELTKAVVEAGVGTDTAPDGRSRTPIVSVPNTLEDSLMARLDRLRSGKLVAQVASVIGRNFSHELLRMVVELDEGGLNSALDELVSSELLLRRGAEPDATYMFKHALIQEAAYASLLRSQLQKLHKRIAEVLREFFPELAETEPEMLGHHYARAHMPDEAIRFLTEAGLRAMSRAAQVEAINHFNAAIDLLTSQPDSEERRAQEVHLRSLLGGALIAIKGYAADEVEATFAKARDLCDKLGDTPMMCPVLYGLWVVNLARSDRARTEDFAAQLNARFGDSPDPLQRIASRFADGITLFYRGDLTASLDRFEQVFEVYEPDMHDALIQGYSDDLAQFAHVQTAWLHTLRGEGGPAGEHEAAAMELARELHDGMSTTRANVFAMMCRREMRDPAATRTYAERAIALANEKVFPFWLSLGQCGLGWATASLGDAEAGIRHIEQGLAFFDLIDQKLPLTYWRSYLIEALVMAGQRQRALELVDDTIALSEANVDSFYEAELLRLKGELLSVEKSTVEEAEALFSRAVEIAGRQAAALHGRRAGESLAALQRQQGREADAEATEVRMAALFPRKSAAPGHEDAAIARQA